MSLATSQADPLIEQEAVIERCLQSFYEMGQALTTIRDAKLYRLSDRTFEDYCQRRWQLTRQRAYQLMSAARTVEILSTKVDNQPSNLPETEKAIRGLTRLQPDQQRQAWSAATAIDPKPSHAQVEKAIAAVKKPQQFQVGQEVMVQAEDSAYAGQLVEVLACDGVIIKAKTCWGEVVPLLTSEIQPEPAPKPAPKPAAQPDYTAVVQAKWQTAEARSLLLEAELKRLIAMIRGRSSYAELEVAAVQAERLVQVDLAA